MNFIEHTPITELNSSTIKWTVRLRAQAVWKGITRESKEFRGINILFVDDSRSRIHGFVAAKYAPLFEKDLVEGDVYKVSNFIVQEYTGMEFNRCVRFDKHIFFAHYTKMERCSSAALTIPKLVVDLFSLKDLESMEEDKRFLCDVCGVVKDPQDLRDYMNDNDEPKQQKKFTLTDGSEEVSVTLFDELAKSLDEAIKEKKNETTIIILSSAKIGKFQGDLCLTNYPAARFYLNDEHHAVKKLRTRYSSTSFSKTQEVTVSQLEQVDIKDMTIKDIKKLKNEAKVNCIVTVKKIQENLNWFFYVCTKCNTQLDYVDGRYKCPDCSRFFPWPQKRFRVFALCSDNTGVLPLVFGDREIRRLTGKMVFDVELDLTEEEDGKFPPVLKTLVNNEYHVTIEVNAENLNNKSQVYEVSDIKMASEQRNQQSGDLQQLSEEAEDDLTIEDMQLQTQSSRAATNKGKKTVENDSTNNTEDATNLADRGSLRKVKNVKIRKENKVLKLKGKNKSSAEKKGRKKINVISESDDEEMTLNTYQMKNRKQG